MQVSSCDGACCAVFPFPRTSREIKEAIEEYGSYNGNDGMMIADMLVPLSTDEAKARCERFGLNPAYVDEYEAQGLRGFTCKHWDEENRACTVYDARPDMCAAYPYERECRHCGESGGCEGHFGWRRRKAENSNPNAEASERLAAVASASLVSLP